MTRDLEIGRNVDHFDVKKVPVARALAGSDTAPVGTSRRSVRANEYPPGMLARLRLRRLLRRR